MGRGEAPAKMRTCLMRRTQEKARRIKAIRKSGLEPIVRVIARGLSEHDALLVEKTLLWKLGGQLTNVSSGHYSESFRPHNTLHTELSGFDFQCGLYYYNVGDGECRCWEDYRTFGFISAGQGKRWREAMLSFQSGDVVAAYLKGHGFVGIGQILDRARPVRDVSIGGGPLLSKHLEQPGLAINASSDDKCEYVATVEWHRSVVRGDAKWQSKAGLYTTTHVRASLDAQPTTIAFLQDEFDIDLRALVQ